MDEVARLRADVERQYGTVYQFCRANGLPRGTTYQVLRGVYAGDMQRQLARIRAALDQQDQAEVLAMQALKRVACARCTRRGPCGRCDDLFRAQARAVMKTISQRVG